MTDNSPERELPACYHCVFNDRGFPCRKADGSFDFDAVAKALVRCGHAFHKERTDEAIYAEHSWGSDCTFEIEQNHPELVFDLVLAAMDACATLDDAAYIAAGPVENMAVKHGQALISRIEAMAKVSAKFRYILSGIWSQGGSVDADVWKRIGIAVAASGRMSSDGRGPWDGKPVTVIDENSANVLLAERVCEVARAHNI